MNKKTVATVIGGLVLAGAVGIGWKAAPQAGVLHALLADTPLRAIFEEGAGFRAELLSEFTRLSLDREQIQTIREIVRSHHSELSPLVRQMADARKAMRDAIRRQPADETAVRATAQKVGEVETELAVARSRVASDVAAVLTDDQKARIKNIGDKIHERVKTVLDRIDSLMEK